MFDAPPNSLKSLKDSNVSPKMKTTKEEELGYIP
jgi:hypothetical protein